MIEIAQITQNQHEGLHDVSRPLILGRYIIAHPKICHGKPTFRGTRIMVADVLEQVADGLDWDSISESWGGKITSEAIAEALSLARTAFLKHIHEFEIEPLAA
jgi:uncharacterized protein (DUF433 family)